MNQSNRPCIIWGSTGQAKVAYDILASEGTEVIHLFDNNLNVDPPLPGIPTSYGLNGMLSFISILRDQQLNPSDIDCIAAIGGAHGDAREIMTHFMESHGFKPRSLIHKSAIISPCADIGKNVQLLAGSIIGAFASVGDYSIINTGANVDHDCIIGRNCHLAPRAVLAGEITVEDNVFVGTNATILPRLRIGSGATVGAGAVVTKDVSPGAIVAGNPARPLARQPKYNAKLIKSMQIKDERASIIRSNASNQAIQEAARQFFNATVDAKYSYCFDWLERPIIQYPQDIVAFQELVSTVKPSLIIETGIAHGGSLVLSASMLCLLDVMEGLDPRQSPRKVVGVDIDIRPHNRKALDEHPLRFKMELIEGSSIDPKIIQQVRSHADGVDRVLVSLDSNHTHEHVLAELNAYADLVSVGGYCVVFDTVVEDLPAGSFPDRPWDVGNNPKTAVHEWLKTHPEFEIDNDIDNKLLISVAPDGYLKRVC